MPGLFWLDVLRFELRLQWRSLRFRVGAALYLIVCSAPPFMMALVLQPQSPHDFGPASYFGWVFDIACFTGLLLAVVVAGNGTGEASQRLMWPVLAAATTETVELTIEAEIEDPAQADTLDVPTEWYEATVYGLAARLSDDYAVNNPRILAIAADALATARAAEDDESVFFAHE